MRGEHQSPTCLDTGDAGILARDTVLIFNEHHYDCRGKRELDDTLDSGDQV